MERGTGGRADAGYRVYTCGSHTCYTLEMARHFVDFLFSAVPHDDIGVSDAFAFTAKTWDYGFKEP